MQAAIAAYPEKPVRVVLKPVIRLLAAVPSVIYGLIGVLGKSADADSWRAAGEGLAALGPRLDEAAALRATADGLAVPGG